MLLVIEFYVWLLAITSFISCVHVSVFQYGSIMNPLVMSVLQHALVMSKEFLLLLF
jgi:hypothetical protein